MTTPPIGSTFSNMCPLCYPHAADAHSGASLRDSHPLTLQPILRLEDGYPYGVSYEVQLHIASRKEAQCQSRHHEPSRPVRGARRDRGGSPGTPLWSNDNGTGLSTLYTGGVDGSTPAIVPLVVRVPGGLDTGIVFNDSDGFTVSAGGVTAPARFIFATLVGTISGWAPNVPLDGAAQLKATVQGAAFTGLANLTTAQGSFLYAADFAGGRIDVFDSNWNLVPSTGGFRDRHLPRGYRGAW